MTQKILIPLDDSAPARYALEEAFRTFPDDQIIVLHVIETSAFTHGPEGGAAESLYEAQKAEADEIFDVARTLAKTNDLDIETRVTTGTPGQEIVAFARDHDIDHIVMGSHGRSGLSRLLLGSVAEHVLRNAPTSVMISRRTD